MTPVSLPTARLERDAGGTPYSPEFKDVYHAAHGGLAQARHVFLAGNGLPQRWAGRESFTMLETGFGLGLNFLASWEAWRADPARCSRMHFISVERAPLARNDLQAALAPFAALQPLTLALLRLYPPPLRGFHRMHFDGGRVALTLCLGDAREMLPQIDARVDAFLLDGFAPSRNPEMWTPEVVRTLSALAAPDATLATWTVAGGVRSALAQAGFAVERQPGLPPKREMLIGRRGAQADAETEARARDAIVIGAGLAGTLVAERLAARDFKVTLLDERPARSAAAVALVRPIANLRDALNAQASRSAYLYSLQHFHGLQHDGYHLQWNRCGVLQLATDEDEAARMDVIARGQDYPDSFMRFVDATGAAAMAQRPVRGPGWHFPDGAAVSLGSLAIASLARAGDRVRPRWNARVERLEATDAGWRACDASGQALGEAQVVVLANAHDAQRLAPEARLRLSCVRGQVTYLPPAPQRALDLIVSGTGYVAPMPDGGHCVGATYQHDDADHAVRAHDHRENLERAESMLPGFTQGLQPRDLQGWTGFRTTVPDRLPIFGALEREGVYTALGLGSRGLLWGPLGAELLASLLAGEPSPLPRELAAALAPRRFLS